MKSRIQLLAPSIAERIAAGEVIERPASVVKELVENCLDAAATEVLVVLENGGKGLIEVLDNGHGMSPEDLALSIERHATSKLTSLDDLEKIATLGFRGEALPSVAAVSDLSILSREQGASVAYELKAGDIVGRFQSKPVAEKTTFGHFIHSPHGTRIRATGLFSQIPARLKFLKSQGSEVSQVREWIERLALAYPQVGFQLVSDDRTVLNLRPQDEKGRILSVLSDGEDYPIVTATHDQDGFRDVGFRFRVHWLQGLSCPNSRKLVQIVNQRAVRDRVLQQALLAPFRQALFPGQFPAVALFIEINPAAIDVNVHPSKAEIRFLDSRKVFHAIESLIKTMIVKEGAPARVPTNSNSSSSSASGGSETLYSRPAVDLGGQDFSTTPTLLLRSSEPEGMNLSWGETNPSPESKSALTEGQLLAEHFGERVPLAPDFGIAAKTESLFSNALHPSNPIVAARRVGVLFNTYLMYEKQDELILIDQHAAHERIRYEKLRRRMLHPATETTPRSSQSLLIPETVRFSLENRKLLETRLEWLSQLGFEAEVFGDNTLLFRAIPSEWGTKNLKSRLKNLIERAIDFEKPDASILVDEALFESLASEACHSSVRAGDPLENEEIETLAQQLFETEHPWNCPHGRPTVVRLPQGKLEEWFQRKILKQSVTLGD